MILLTVLSLMPMDDFDLGGPEIPYMDKWIHMGFYFTAMLLGVFFLWERSRHRMKKKPSMIWMGAGSQHRRNRPWGLAGISSVKKTGIIKLA